MDKSSDNIYSFEEILGKLNAIIADHSVYSKMNRVFTDSVKNSLSQAILLALSHSSEFSKSDQSPKSDLKDIIVFEIGSFLKTNKLKIELWKKAKEKLEIDLQKELIAFRKKFEKLGNSFYNLNDKTDEEILKGWVTQLYSILEKKRKIISQFALKTTNCKEKNIEKIALDLFENGKVILDVFISNFYGLNQALLNTHEYYLERKKNKKKIKTHLDVLREVAKQSYNLIFVEEKIDYNIMVKQCMDLYKDENEKLIYKHKINKEIIPDNVDGPSVGPIITIKPETAPIESEIEELLKTPENLIKEYPKLAFQLIKKHYPLYGLEKYFYLTRISDVYEVKENNVVLDSLKQKAEFGYSEQTRRYFITRAIEKLQLIWEDKAELSKLVKVIKPELRSYLERALKNTLS